MQGKRFVLLLKLHCILCLVSAIQRKDLFPFGPHAGDLTLQEGDDETSAVIKLKRPLVFYDTHFNNLYVGTNGIISLQDLPRETQYVDDGFPFDFPVIAPYLSDIDTSRGRGRIYYREDNSSDTLDRAGQEIRRAFPQSSFTPTNTFIATWENVAPYEEVTRSTPSSNRFNTFQAVLAFDESNSYAIFLYPEDGLHFFGTRPKESYNVQIELPARIGFNRGETGYTQWRRESSYYSITTNEQSVKHLYQRGNSGTRGEWVFHIGGTSSFNNIMQAKARVETSGEDHIVTLDSSLRGPVIPVAQESDYAENEDYNHHYDNEESEYTPSISMAPHGRVAGIPDDPPYPDAGIIPSYPEGYPEAGVMSSYPESGAFPSYPERGPEVGTRMRYPNGYSEIVPRNQLPVTSGRHVVSVDEEEELGTGVFTYNTGSKETCERNQEQCSQNAYCTDYSSGFCCHCQSGYYGNGRQCLPEGVTQRVNGKVNGKLMVGDSRRPVEFENADLHAYVVINDGRSFTAISQIPGLAGWAMQSLSIIGDLFGWLFALQQPGFKNGFSIAGAKFIRNIDITFSPGNKQLNVIQIAQGLDAQNYLSVTTEIEGELPDIAVGASVHIQPYNEVYYRSSSAITSTAYRDYSVESTNGETQRLRYQLKQNITYYDCEHAPKTIPAAQQLNAERILVLYNQSEQVVRYGMISQIGPVRDNSRLVRVNPCQDGTHGCDPKAQCYPVNDHDHICTCAPGYEGDGKVCTATSERPKTACEQQRERLQAGSIRGPLFGVHIPQCDDEGNFRPMQCHSSTGYCWCVYENGQEVPGTRVAPGTRQARCELPSVNERPKSACEQQRERLETEMRLRGPLLGVHIPQCDDEGNFRLMQCHSSTGHCWCVYENGQEVPGTRRAPGTGQPHCGQPASERPKSACEQQRERLQAEGSQHGLLVGLYIPQCDDEGNFRPMQCHGSTGYCWCVYENGQEVAGTRTAPGTGQPRCEVPVTNERPKSACEQQRERIQTEMSLRGPLVGHHIPQCDEEGNFRPMQCHSSTGYCWCVYENGQEVPGTRTAPGTGQPRCGEPATERPKSVCEQHRERVESEMRGSQPLVGIHIPQCDDEGNFRPMQCHGSTGYCWCVYENGQEVLGTRTAPGTGQPRCGELETNERPKTACQLQQERLRAILSLRRPISGLHIPQCDEEGNFSPLQCHGSTGYCWCVYENGQEVPGTMTPPGTSQPHCEQPGDNEHPKTACEQQREHLETMSQRGSLPLVGLHIPQCDDEGNFRPMQCHSSTGYCWCVYENGQEIIGTRRAPGTGQPRCGLTALTTSERRKTACEEQRERLQTELTAFGSEPRVGLYIPQCDDEGNFRPMQCQSSTGHCWCVDENGQEVAGTRTAPGSAQPRCGLPAGERPKSACEQQRERLQAEGSQHGLLVGLYIPQCDDEGNFRPMQCHGSTGYCWCVYENGQEVAGTRTAPGTGQPRCEVPALTTSERRKTACEEQRERLQTELTAFGSEPRVGLYIPQCDDEGNFRPMQCQSSTGHCWCVDENGQEVAGTRTAPGSAQPRCGLPAGERPKSACEQQRERLQAEGSQHGLLVGLYIPQCDDEGNFRPMQCHGSTGYCWCVYENGQEVAGTRTAPGTGQPRCEVPASDRPKSACEQQREWTEAEMSLRGPLLGVHIPQCDDEGNFRPMQCHSSTGHCWCVDENGREVAGTRTAPGSAQPRCGLPASERPKSACEQQRERLQAEGSQHGLLVGLYIPQCDDEGNFRPMQCHGSTGYCWCVYENGQEVAGTRTAPGTGQPRCEVPTLTTSERRKTACEEQRERLQTELTAFGSEPRVGLYIPQCDDEGNFRPMQCQSSSGHCWCVDENGQEVAGTRTAPGSAQPRCGLPASERPKSACEQQRERLQAEGSQHGLLVGLYIPQCDDEGNFRPMQCHGSTGYCWCVYENGQEVAGTRTAPGTGQPRCEVPALTTSERRKTACEEQRERLQTELTAFGSEPRVGLYIPQCDDEGNFRPMQCQSSTGHCWCVDENGREIAGTRTAPGSAQPRCGHPVANERSKSACEQQREQTQAEVSLRGPLVGLHIPQCDEEGKFRLMQCHSSTGYCWCVYENGQEVPGTRTAPGTGQPRCGEPVLTENSKPPCVELRDQVQAELSQSRPRPAVGVYVPQCDAEGNFKPLQCHSSTGQCWCVDELGREISGTRTLPGSAHPQCGQPELSPQPQTVCERWRFNLLKDYGGRPADDQYVPQCTELGDFSPLQCYGNSGYCWCVDKDGREIQGTRTEPGTPPACIPTVAPPTTQPTTASVLTAPPRGVFLLYAQGQHIGYLPLNGTRLNTEEAKSLLALHGSIIIGIDYDCRDKMVYWTDVAGRTINRVSLEPGAEPEIIINTGLTSPEGLTIDYIRRNLFWTDSGLDKIETAAIDGSKRRVLVDTDLVNPRAIVVDSHSGNLYWTDWNREAPKIETSHLDGTNRRILVKNDIGLPNGLTFDPFSSQLCWADAGTKDLECIFPDGTGRRVVQSGLNYPFSIVAYSNHFYYTDWRRDGIIVVPKDGSQMTDEYLPDQRSHLYGITVAYPRCPYGRK
ncbi:nidogen-2 isoform X5 [Mobula hypostoma]|uniref:nidogen-2 isoform X5 n=1 Tax=Mobula hypostoma TaxID=723540 RepID=UPI002FC3861E